ncbi:MAG TPA: hypothetical protein VGF94_27710 [Kofleriaceae bacterium]
MLDHDSLVEISASTAGIAHIASATLALDATGWFGPSGFLWESSAGSEDAATASAMAGVPRRGFTRGQRDHCQSDRAVLVAS